MARLYHTAHKRAKHRNLVRNLVTELVIHEHIKVTKKRKVATIKLFDHIVTLAKKGTLHDIRQIAKVLRLNVKDSKNQEYALQKIKKIALANKDRNGGYLSTCNLGKRRGDNASLYYLKVL